MHDVPVVKSCVAATARHTDWLIPRAWRRMAEPMMTIRSFIALGVLGASAAASLTACQPAAPSATAVTEPPLAGARIGGTFALTDQTGRRVTDTDFAGRYRIVYFGYSFCPDVCPVDLNRLMLGLSAFERSHPALGARIQPMFITIDPARDTPAVLRVFAAQFHPRLLALRGTAAETAAVAQKYLVQYQRQDGVTPGSYLMAHSQLAYLMDPDGKPLALLPIDDPRTDPDEGAPALVAADLARWVH
jgi:protein SCO1